MRKVAELLAGKAAVVQINTDESPNTSSHFGVRGIPALFLLRHGKVIDQLTGVQPVDAILAWFNRHQG